METLGNVNTVVPKAAFRLQLKQLQFTKAKSIMTAHKSHLLAYGVLHFNFWRSRTGLVNGLRLWALKFIRVRFSTFYTGILAYLLYG